VELGAWFIFPPDAETVFDSDPDSLWLQMIQKTELKLAGSEPADADQRTLYADEHAVSAALGARRSQELLRPQQSFQDARLDKGFEKARKLCRLEAPN